MLNENLVSSKQFHGCNAFVNTYEKSHGVVYELVSYCTPVARVTKRGKGDRRFVTSIDLAPAARCSVTTCKQVSRFLHEYAGSAGDKALGKFYSVNGAGYHCSNFTLNYSVLFDEFKFMKVDEYSAPRHLIWFYQTFTPWNGYYNGADIWVNGQHGKQV